MIMLKLELRYCLRQTLITLILFTVAPMMYLLDVSTYKTGLGLLWYMSNGSGLAILSLSILMAMTTFGRERRDNGLEYLLSLPIGRWKLFLNKVIPRLLILMVLLVVHQVLLHITSSYYSVLGGCLLSFSITNNFALLLLIVLLGFAWGVIGTGRVVSGLVFMTILTGLWMLYPWGLFTVSQDLNMSMLRFFSMFGLRGVYLGEMLPWTISWVLVTGLLVIAFVPVYRRWDVGSSRSREIAFLKLASIPFLMISLTVIGLYSTILK